MNSSGIKRGLATTAVSALAVAGIPFIATSASASATELTVANVGPVRDGNADGGTIVFSVPEAMAATVDGQVKLIRSDLTGLAGNQNTPAQTVAKVGAITPTAEGSEVYGSKTATDEFSAQISVDTAPTGATANFAVFIDTNGNNAVDAAEFRTQVQVTTAGAPTQVVISPDTNTTATGVASPEYTATIRDAEGRLTQAVTGEGFAITGTGGAVATPAALTPALLADGSEKFTATAPTGGTKTLTIAGTGITPASVSDTATLVVLEQATITPDEFDLVTGADTYEKGEAFGGTYAVRVDQGTITFDFASKDTSTPADGPDDAGKVILLTLSSATGLKFDGETSKVYSVVLGADGKGSLSVKPTGINDASSFTFASTGSSIASTTVNFDRAGEGATVVATPSVYVTKVGSPTTVTVKATDEFGNAVSAPTQVSITRGARNGSTATARQTVGADGTATFSLPDAGTTAGTESFGVNVYDDQFDASAVAGTGGTINYTADGLGADFSVSGATADPAATVITPLYDATSSAASSADTVVLNITGATAGTPAKITADNGALILLGGADDTLNEGSASETITLAAGSGSVRVIGTKTGVVTVTIENAGRTKTVKLTVKQPTDAVVLAGTARNVELDGPAKATAGDVATYVATVTDAFGNTVAGVDAARLDFSVSGPANLQNEEAATDSNGELEQTVLLTDNANSDITVKVSGNGAQFGKAANSLTVANDAPGLSASVSTDSVTTEVVNLAQLQQDVEDAQAALDEAQANLEIAQGNLDVAQAELAVAQAKVDTAAAKVATLENKLDKAKDAGKKAKVKKLRKALKNAKAALAAAQDELTIATAKVAAAQTVVDRRQDQVDAAQADLDEAEAALEAAQG
ncbi:unannotated protein [freshwater metagenome]|uniref:Unannotated protein n=1 Tax=freshwater metagenome TaxID=449393 RepID=A0A6J6TJD1_9ZZZZ|nr:hypothetical protein [Actinomycetota bacterium]